MRLSPDGSVTWSKFHNKIVSGGGVFQVEGAIMALSKHSADIEVSCNQPLTHVK